jgi:hypothetical protein
VFVLRPPRLGAFAALASTLVGCSLLTSLDGLTGGADGGEEGGDASLADVTPAAAIADAGSDPDSAAVLVDSAPDPADAADGSTDAAEGSIDAGSDAAREADTGVPPELDAGHVDACVPTALVCDGKAHKCDGVVDEGCPSAITIGAPGSSQILGTATGGTAFDDPCPAGQVLIGIGGSTGSWIDTIYGICGVLGLHATTSVSPYSYSVTIAMGTTLPTEGTLGGSDTSWQAKCPANQAVVAVAGNSGAGMDHVTLSCAGLTISGSPGSFALHQGTVTTLAPEGDVGGGSPFTPAICPDPQVMSLVSGTAGQWVNTLGVACATPQITVIP